MSASVERSPPNVRRPPAVPDTSSPHACRYLDSRRAPMPHLPTPHAGTARTHPHPACTQNDPGNKVFRIWQAGALDSGNKIAASAHGMGSGGLAVDAMAIGCLGVERRVERFFFILSHFQCPMRPKSLYVGHVVDVHLSHVYEQGFTIAIASMALIMPSGTSLARVQLGLVLQP